MSEEAQKTFGMRESRFNRHPIGSGRFQFIEWQGDEFIHLRRYEDYWEGPAEYHDFYMRISPELFTQEVEFRTGAIDFYGAQPHQVDRYKNDPQYQWFSSLAFAYTYIGYNIRKPLFADPMIRTALGMAINVDEIITYPTLFTGTGDFGPGMSGSPVFARFAGDRRVVGVVSAAGSGIYDYNFIAGGQDLTDLVIEARATLP